MKSWKKQLNDELDLLVPPLSETVKNAPIITSTNVQKTTSASKTKTKKWLGLSSLLATAVVAMVFVFLGVIGVFNAPGVSDKYVFTLEINPAVVFVTDEAGTVKSIKALNEDADIILSNETELNKMQDTKLDDAIVIYVDNATKLGFLDVTKQENAVRLSSNVGIDNEIFDKVATGIEGYFMDKGIFSVVVKNTSSISDMCQIIGIDNSSDITQLTEQIDQLSTLYKQNIESDATVADLYNKYILNTSFIDVIKNDLLNNIALIVENETALSNILNLYFQILEKSPSLFMDYWTLEKQDKSELDGELLALMNQMSTALEQYKTKFNKEISSYTELQLAVKVYSPFVGSNLESIIQDLSSEIFLSNKDSLIGILKNIGIEVTSFEQLLQAPKTITEYLEQVELVSDLLRDFRTNMYSEVYGQNREKISEVDYSDFVSNIITKYGSLENYWSQK